MNLNPGVNIFIGPTGSGKSSLTRAIKWVMTNKPRGDSFITTGRDACEVRLHLNKSIVIRKKTRKGTNEYVIKTEGEEDEKFSSFGNNIPEEVLKIFGTTQKALANDTINRSDLNFLEQMDAPFLLDSSPRTRALVLGALVGAEEVDAAFKITKLEKLNAESNLKYAEETITKTETKLERFVDIDSAKELLKEVSELTRQEEDMKQKVVEGEDLLQVYKTNMNAVKSLEPYVKEIERTIKSAEVTYNDLCALKRVYNEANELVQRAKTLDEEVGTFSRNNKTIEQLILKAEDTGVKLDKEVENAERNERLQREYGRAIAEELSANEQVDNIKKTIEQGQQVLKSTIEKMDICPFSKGEFYQQCKDRVAKNG